MAKTKRLPPRRQVKLADTWNLASLFSSDNQWDEAFRKWQRQIRRYGSFRGTLGDGPAALAKCLRFDSRMQRAGERPAEHGAGVSRVTDVPVGSGLDDRVAPVALDSHGLLEVPVHPGMPVLFFSDVNVEVYDHDDKKICWLIFKS